MVVCLMQSYSSFLLANKFCVKEIQAIYICLTRGIFNTPFSLDSSSPLFKVKRVSSLQKSDYKNITFKSNSYFTKKYVSGNYSKIHSVPRSKHTFSVIKTSHLMQYIGKLWLFVLRSIENK
jgi:hypothetical protein